MRSLKLLYIPLFVSLISVSCKKESSPSDPTEEEPYLTVNTWIQETMDIYYYWEDNVRDDVDGTMQPENYFESMLYEDDIFSYMSDDSEELLNDLDGISYEAGYSPAFGQFSNSEGVFIIVEFVYPGTPAEEAGLKRGDIILGINGNDLTTVNYQNLYYSEGPSVLSLGEYTVDGEGRASIGSSGRTITVDKEVLDLSPVVLTKIHETGDHKIGYLFYASFTNGTNGIYNDEVLNEFQKFKDQGITDLVIDLRYNPGGSISASTNMANAIVPASNANAEDVFVNFKYNSYLQNYFSTREGPDSPNLVVNFDPPTLSLGLDRIYFLATGSSASASELIINGLRPYMDVYAIGENTYGKFYGSFVLTGEDATPPNDYAVVPVTLKYANADGVTDFADGLEPDFEAEENIFDPLPLGDPNDPLFATAIEHITEGAVVAKRKPEYIMPYQKLIDPIKMQKGTITRKAPVIK